MKRCLNCGKAINFLSPDFDSSMNIVWTGGDLCKSCGTLPLHQIINIRGDANRKERESDNSDYDNEINDLQRQIDRFERDARRESQDDIINLVRQEMIQEQNLIKIKEKINEEKIEIITRMNELIKKAVSFGVEPHAFDSNNVCIFCKQHINNILTPKCED